MYMLGVSYVYPLNCSDNFLTLRVGVYTIHVQSHSYTSLNSSFRIPMKELCPNRKREKCHKSYARLWLRINFKVFCYRIKLPTSADQFKNDSMFALYCGRFILAYSCRLKQPFMKKTPLVLERERIYVFCGRFIPTYSC